MPRRVASDASGAGGQSFLVGGRADQYVRINPAGVRDIAGTGLGVPSFSGRMLHQPYGRNHIPAILHPGTRAQGKLAALWAGVNWHRPVIISLLILGFILVLERLGFILTSFLLLFILFKWVEKFSWRKAIIIPALTLGLYLSAI